ncbi:pyridoxal-phosphate-dependent aminotransferase family protein [Rhodopirellula sp. MGV]|uniref:pyridoxal-phosphate-dependent aminotransferase family protein n=1 Tax=Rhodopirellula sp. MGV TaxID=2023130 RepID=UPI000B95C9AA|nr:alanine--glyoxylate aminotransferase family protein [Rhodopirellula sp. MGV]OYP34589.1 alanine--glyoxylate aminotransferase [Rhodopirellula sp. MGV]PNY37318.1 alanine--glyoxylate aminotransferase family protein [Rhodopirellula baltica]
MPAALNPRQRLLMGPGPSTVPARILKAISSPTLGHLDPQYIGYMDETCEMIRQVYRTENALSFPVSGTGMAGMETVMVNLIEPGDEAIVMVNGVFGGRMKDILTRCGAEVHAIEIPWGQSFSKQHFADAVAAHPNAKLLAVVHAETSTGALQDLSGVGEIVHQAGMLLVVDAVTSIGGHDVRVDDWGIDAIYSGTQKCLSCPPGLSPVSFSPRALETIDARKTPVRSWYLDVTMLKNYYTGGGGRAYHHTAPINMVYALREALAIVLEEGLDERIERHRDMHLLLREGLESLGLKYIPDHSLHTLNCVAVPDGIDEAAIRKRLLTDFDIEIGGGLGVFAGKAWRIGLMGESAAEKNILTLLAALDKCLR